MKISRPHTAIAGLLASAVISLPSSVSMNSDSARPTMDLSQSGIPSGDGSLSLRSAQQAQDIDPDIRGWYTFDDYTGLYTYSYRVWNKSTATNAIWHFALAPVPRPISVTVPNDAWDYSFGYEERDDALVWMVLDAGEAPADWDSVSLWPSAFDIQPGDSTIGFSFATPAPPSMVSYYVQGFYSPPPGEEEDFTDPFTLFQNSLTGTIVGPGSAVDVEDRQPAGAIRMQLPTPNPATGSVAIAYYLPHTAQVRLSLYAVSGRLVRVLADGVQPAGFYSANWNGTDAAGRRMPPGVYFYGLFVNGQPAGARRLVILP
jgi:hypothetical protein